MTKYLKISQKDTTLEQFYINDDHILAKWLKMYFKIKK